MHLRPEYMQRTHVTNFFLILGLCFTFRHQHLRMFSLIHMRHIRNSSPPINITPSLRLEQGFAQGSQIGVFYDPMIAKLISHGRDRTEALRILRKALDEYHVVGVSTNVEFLRSLAGNQAFIDQELETGFIPV